jgi:hypothetical protein
MTRVVLDEHDADAVLRILYNGTRPARVHTLVCGCGALADLRVNANAWNGWQVLPHAMCPACRELGPTINMAELYPAGAHERFTKMIEVLSGKVG